LPAKSGCNEDTYWEKMHIGNIKILLYGLGQYSYDFIAVAADVFANAKQNFIVSYLDRLKVLLTVGSHFARIEGCVRGSNP
jgi:hypothetical protein